MFQHRVQALFAAGGVLMIASGESSGWFVAGVFAVCAFLSQSLSPGFQSLGCLLL